MNLCRKQNRFAFLGVVKNLLKVVDSLSRNKACRFVIKQVQDMRKTLVAVEIAKYLRGESADKNAYSNWKVANAIPKKQVVRIERGSMLTDVIHYDDGTSHEAFPGDPGFLSSDDEDQLVDYFSPRKMKVQPRYVNNFVPDSDYFFRSEYEAFIVSSSDLKRDNFELWEEIRNNRFKDLTICGDIEPNPGPRGKRVPASGNRRRRAPARKRNNNNENPSRGLERPFPNRKMIKVITTSDGSAQNTAAGYAVIECDLADPTNAGFASGVGTGAFTVATSGISDMASYALARVKSVTIEVSGTSNDTSAVIACDLIFSDTRPSTGITSFALAKSAQINFLHTPIRKIAIAAGNSAFRFRPITVSARQVIGDIMPTTDRDFVTVVNPSHTAPNQTWWCALIVTSIATGTNLTNGLEVSLTVTQKVEAFSRLIGT